MERCRIPIQALADLRDGLIEPVEAEQLNAHLAQGCGRCSESMAFLRSFGAAAAGAHRFVPSTETVESARSIYRERFRLPERAPLLTRLLFDSRWGMALAGARGVSASHQSLFSAGDYDLDVWQERDASGGSYLIAQALDRETGAALSVSKGVLSVDSSGSFAGKLKGEELHFAAVPDGRAALTIELVRGAALEAEILVGDEAPPDGR